MAHICSHKSMSLAGLLIMTLPLALTWDPWDIRSWRCRDVSAPPSGYLVTLVPCPYFPWSFWETPRKPLKIIKDFSDPANPWEPCKISGKHPKTPRKSTAIKTSRKPKHQGKKDRVDSKLFTCNFKHNFYLFSLRESAGMAMLAFVAQIWEARLGPPLRQQKPPIKFM